MGRTWKPFYQISIEYTILRKSGQTVRYFFVRFLSTITSLHLPPLAAQGDSPTTSK